MSKNIANFLVFYLKCSYFLMPCWSIFKFLKFKSQEFLIDLKGLSNNMIQRIIISNLSGTESILFLHKLGIEIGNIPRLENCSFIFCIIPFEFLNFLKLLMSLFKCFLGQFFFKLLKLKHFEPYLISK